MENTHRLLPRTWLLPTVINRTGSGGTAMPNETPSNNGNITWTFNYCQGLPKKAKVNITVSFPTTTESGMLCCEG